MRVCVLHSTFPISIVSIEVDNNSLIIIIIIIIIFIIVIIIIIIVYDDDTEQCISHCNGIPTSWDE